MKNKCYEQYKEIFNAMHEGFCIVKVFFNEDNKPVDYLFLEVNHAFEKQTGLNDVVGKRMLHIAPHHEKHWFETYGRVALTGNPIRFQNEAKALNKYFDVYAFPIGKSEDRHVAVLFYDISEKRISEEALKTSEGKLLDAQKLARNSHLKLEEAYNQIAVRHNEKEVLMKEIYHRTKNTLQLISSLLTLKSASLNYPETEDMISDIKLRIQAISLVHDKLYNSENLSRINLKEYVSQLAALLIENHFMSHKIKLKLKLEEIHLLIDMAIPCGLIITELVTNSIKYAFPKDKQGYIEINLKKDNNQLIELVIADNGVGFANPNNIKEEKIGLQLFKELAFQLHGEVELKSDHGVKWTIWFKDGQYYERV